MCTLLFAWQVDPARPLIVAANRDEFYARPTAVASTWPRALAGDPEIVAGRDLLAGGTWLGVTREGRFAALTNVREPFVATPPGAPSRGGLVAEFLRGRAAPAAYVTALRPDTYAGFNLIVGDRDSLWYLSNRSGPARALAPGVYGVSNAAMDTPWPKVRRGRENLARLVAAGEATAEALLVLLADRAQAPDAELPATGVGLAMERVLSPLLIASPGYGTHSSTAVIIHRDGTVEFREHTHDPARTGDVSITMSRER
jgi:uncharacterized protein with NRDE domain